jgi:uncharacterized protein YggE
MQSPAAFLLPLLILVAPAFADEAKPRTITTTGTASVFVAPDEVSIRFSVNTFDKDLLKSKQINDAAANETLAFIKSMGVEAKNIQSTAVNSSAVYEYRQEYNRQVRGAIVGFDVTRSYGVKLRDLTKLGPIYDKLLPDARVSLESQTLSTSELRKHRDKARTDAAKAAREKAELLAAACDAKVGAAREVNESTPSVGFYRGYANVAQVAFDAGGGGGGGEDVSPVGQIEVQATVAVVYDLIPNATKE